MDDNRNFKDLFEDSINKQSLNFIAGRSVACVDRMGNGKILFMYLIMEGLQDFIVFKEKTVDEAPKLNINKITGGRAIVAGHILSDRVDMCLFLTRGDQTFYMYLKINLLMLQKIWCRRHSSKQKRFVLLDIFIEKETTDIITTIIQLFIRIYAKKINF